MRLTQLLFRRDYLPNGSIYRGKDRMVKRVTPRHLRKIQEDFSVEEQNMLYLRHPYLTEEQSHGHGKALGKPEERRDKLIKSKITRFKPDITLFDRLLHLRVGESWDK